MADDVVIGSASVQITGDYSGLEKSFQQSQQLAQSAGQKISAAFDSATSGASELTKATATLASTVEDLANKSGLAGGELAIFRAALQGSLDSGLSVDEALKEISASSVNLGTAVAGAAQALGQEAAAAGDAASASDKASDSFKRVRTDAEAFEKAWSEAIAENVKRSTAEFEKFANDVGNFIAHPLQAAGAAVKEFLLAIGPMGAVALAGAAALALVAKETFNLVEAAGKAAEATGNMADRLNLTWRETRNLEEMAQIAGVSISGLQQASFRLAESLEGTSAQSQKTAKALTDIGVAGETSGELLKGFLERLAQIPDDTKRIALAHEVLGRSSQQIIPLIKNYAELQDAITHLGPAIDDNMAKKLQASDDALDKLSISWNRFKESIAVFAAPAVQGFVDVLTAFVAGGTMPTIDKQIQDIEAKMVSLGEKSALAGWLMADGFTKGKDAELELLKAQREHLVGVEQAIQRSKEYNAEVAKSNAAARAASQPGLVQAIIDKQKELTGAVTAAHAAYNTLNQAYQTGTPLASGYAVTSGDVARALANLTAAEAAAATTKADHTEKTKALTAAHRGYSDAIAVLMAMEHQELATKHSVIEETAKYNEITKLSLSPLQYLQLQIAKTTGDFATFDALTGKASSNLYVMSDAATMAANAVSIFERSGQDNQLAISTSEAKTAFDALAPAIDKSDKLIAEMGKDAAATQKQLAALSPEGKMADALAAIGIKWDKVTNSTDRAKQSAAEYVAANTDDLNKAAVAWEVLNSSVNRLSRVNLPEAIKVQNELITSMERMGAPLGEIYAAQQKEMQLEIDMRSQRGESANAQVIALENLKLKTDALYDSSQLLGKLYVSLVKDFQGAFDALGKGIADTIVDGKNFWDSWHKILNDLEKQIIEQIVHTALKAVADALINNIGLASKFATTLGGAASGGASSAATGAAGSVANAGGSAASAGSSAASAASGAIGIANLVTGAITAISSVVGNFQMAHMSSDLQKIEESTRYLKIGLVTQSDGLLTTSHQTLDAINQMLIQMKGIVGINLTGTISQDASNKLLDDLVNSGQNLYVVAARTLTEIRDSVRGGTDLLMGQLHEIARGVNPSVGQRLLNSAIGGLFSNITGAASGIGSVLGAVGGLFGGGGGNSSDSGKIEEHTRMLAIGLVTQGDSLLSDSHTIRNILSDFMKWNQDVFQTYLQNINMDLDKLTNMGGIHSAGSMSQIGSFSANKAVVADQSTNVNVTIDTVASDITDTKVRDVFNRGIRMSKLAGAFPAGRFPQ